MDLGEPVTGYDDDALNASTRQYVTFSCAGQTFAIDIMSVREIRNWSPVTRLPGQTPDVLGMIDIRGRVVPVHDLALRIGCAASGKARETQVVLVLSLDQLELGLVVDGVSDIISVGADDLLEVPELAGNVARFLSAIVRQDEQLVAILDEHEIQLHSAAMAKPASNEMTPEAETEQVYVD